jgi:HK97 family phage major capsid protein
MPSPALTTTWGQQEWSTTLIEALFVESVLLRAGPNRVTTDGRIVHIPRLLVAPRADWVEELRELPSDAGEADTLDLTPKKVGNVIALSNESIEDSSASQLDRVGRAMTRGVATKVDAKAFSSDRVEARAPAGLYAEEFRVPSVRQREGILLRTLITGIGVISGKGGVPNAVFVSAEDATALRLEALMGSYATLADPTAPGIERVGGAQLYVTPSLARGNALVADMNYVTVAVRRDATVDFSPDAGFTKDATLARVTMRVDWAPSDPAALYRVLPES